MTKEEQEEQELVDPWDGFEVEMEQEGPNVELDEEEEPDEDEPEDQEDIEDKEGSDEVNPDLELEVDDEESDDDDSEPEDEEEQELTIVQSIQKHLGYEFDEEFEDTEEGIQQLVEASARKMADDQLETIFSQFPDVQELFEYRRMGGDPDQFFQTKFPEVDFSKVEFKEDDVRQHEDLVKQELIQIRGYTPEEVEAEIKDYKNGGILENKAKRALQALQTKQQEDKESLLKEQKEQFEQRKQKIEDYWNNVEETINKSSTFKAFQIPSKDKEEFFEYISRPVKEGMSQRDLDVQEADLETRLAIDYLLFKGFDLSGIINRKAKDQNAKTLKERLQQSKLDRKSKERSSENGQVEELGTI